MSKLSKGIKIGLTGAIASGKSTALEVFKSLGFYTFSADEAIKQLYNDHTFCKQLAAYMPQVIVDGKINKTMLLVVLQDENLYRRVIPWMHEGVLRKMLNFHNKYAHANTVCEIPLLFEVGWQQYFDEIWCIALNDTLSKQRALQRGMSPQLYTFLKAKQWDITHKCSLADVVIFNEDTLTTFVKQLQHVIKERL